MTSRHSESPAEAPASNSELDVRGRVDTERLNGLTYPIGTLADQLAGLGRILAADSLDLTTARTAVLSGVVHALPAMSWASLTSANGRSRPVTLAASADTAKLVDAIQYRTEGGPCLQAVAETTIVRADDLSREDRWAPFVATALSETPVRAVVSCSLADGGHPEISLNMYSARPLSEDRPDLDGIAAIAAACSVALSAIDQRHRADHLEKALESGRRIGAAMGILMATRRLTEPQAFDALRVASQHSQRKLRDVAEDVLLTGELPTSPLPWHASRTDERTSRSARPTSPAHLGSRPAEHPSRPAEHPSRPESTRPGGPQPGRVLLARSRGLPRRPV